MPEQSPPKARPGIFGALRSRLQTTRQPPPSAATCEHLALTTEPAPAESSTCVECEREGQSPVHLRRCEDCGFVGCCDSSPGQHANAHYEATGHPVMRSYEPGESWRWCCPHGLLG